MANVLLTPSIIAKEALMRLKNNLVFANLVYRDYSKEFVKGVGDTVKIRVPATFTANEFTGTVAYQDIQEGYTEIKLDKILDVSFKVSSKELTLDIEEFGEQYLEGAMIAFADKIDQMLAGLYVDIPYFVDASATPSASDIANIASVLDMHKVPLAGNLRRLVLSPSTQTSYVTLDAFLHAEKKGDTETLREANLGRVFTLDTYMDQNIPVHVKGTLGATATASGTAGAYTVTITGTAESQTIKKGDLITFADVSGQYVCTADAVTPATPYTVNVSIYPALSQTFSNKTVTLHASHYANLAFHRNAFALATATLEPPLGGVESAVANDPETGLGIRVVYGYDIDGKANLVSLDMLVGVKTLNPEMAVRFCKA